MLVPPHRKADNSAKQDCGMCRLAEDKTPQ